MPSLGVSSLDLKAALVAASFFQALDEMLASLAGGRTAGGRDRRVGRLRRPGARRPRPCCAPWLRGPARAKRESPIACRAPRVYTPPAPERKTPFEPGDGRLAQR